MAIKIGSNFTFQGQQPNFERDRFATKAAMKAFPETSIDDGHLSYCAEDGNIYQFKSSNGIDAVTGKWRIFKDGFSADTISTEPNQFLAGPINTRGNIGLRKIDASDLPDLSSTYATKDSVTKKVDIRGKSYYRPGSTGQTDIVKILTIVMPESRYQTGFLGLTLMCRDEQLIKILITINTTHVTTKVNVIESSTKPHPNELLHYWYDTANKTFTLYYTSTPYDTITAKVTDKDNNVNFTYNLDLIAVDALPEGAIQVHNVNYGNKNLFCATPKDVAGDPTFRAIDIADIPDLSSKYGTKAEISTINNSITDVRASLESTQIDFVDLRNKVNAMPKIVILTQAAYTALTTKDPNTIYYING